MTEEAKLEIAINPALASHREIDQACATYCDKQWEFPDERDLRDFSFPQVHSASQSSVGLPPPCASQPLQYNKLPPSDSSASALAVVQQLD